MIASSKQQHAVSGEVSPFDEVNTDIRDKRNTVYVSPENPSFDGTLNDINQSVPDTSLVEGKLDNNESVRTNLSLVSNKSVLTKSVISTTVIVGGSYLKFSPSSNDLGLPESLGSMGSVLTAVTLAGLGMWFTGLLDKFAAMMNGPENADDYINNVLMIIGFQDDERNHLIKILGVQSIGGLITVEEEELVEAMKGIESISDLRSMRLCHGISTFVRYYDSQTERNRNMSMDSYVNSCSGKSYNDILHRENLRKFKETNSRSSPLQMKIGNNPTSSPNKVSQITSKSPFPVDVPMIDTKPSDLTNPSPVIPVIPVLEVHSIEKNDDKEKIVIQPLSYDPNCKYDINSDDSEWGCTQKSKRRKDFLHEELGIIANKKVGNLKLSTENPKVTFGITGRIIGTKSNTGGVMTVTMIAQNLQNAPN